MSRIGSSAGRSHEPAGEEIGALLQTLRRGAGWSANGRVMAVVALRSRDDNRLRLTFLQRPARSDCELQS